MADARRTSETALFAALCRATAAFDHGGANGLGTDGLAIRFLPPHLRFLLRFDRIRARVRDRNAAMTPGGYEYLLARTACFDSMFKAVLADAIPQVVLVGAGYDTRSCRLPPPGDTRIFEVDMPVMQTRKRKILAKAGLSMPASHTWVPLDVTRASLAESLQAAGFDTSQQTVFLAEGLTMYLDAAAVTAMFDLVATSGAGSRMAFDYVTSTADDAGFGVREFMATWQKHRKGEPFTFTATDDELADLARLSGLDTIDITSDLDIHARWLTSAIGPVTGFFRIAEVARS